MRYKTKKELLAELFIGKTLEEIEAVNKILKLIAKAESSSSTQGGLTND